jgi:hypothetical protein
LSLDYRRSQDRLGGGYKPRAGFRPALLEERPAGAFPSLGKRAPWPWEIAARRRNPLKSTGPCTAAGKRRSSLNGLQRGLCAPWREHLLLLSCEDRRDYRRLHRDLISVLQPEDPYISHLVAALTDEWWKKVETLQTSS